MLKILKQFFNYSFTFFEETEKKRRNAYLSEAVNIQDLERRMRKLEQPKHPYGY
jgi:hypothetical protein